VLSITKGLGNFYVGGLTSDNEQAPSAQLSGSEGSTKPELSSEESGAIREGPVSDTVMTGRMPMNIPGGVGEAVLDVLVGVDGREAVVGGFGCWTDDIG